VIDTGAAASRPAKAGLGQFNKKTGLGGDLYLNGVNILDKGFRIKKGPATKRVL